MWVIIHLIFSKNDLKKGEQMEEELLKLIKEKKIMFLVLEGCANAEQYNSLLMPQYHITEEEFKLCMKFISK